MNSSNFRQTAQEKLNGKWGKAICILLAYLAITFVFSLLSNFFPTIGAIITIVIEVPLSFGLVFSFFKLFYNEDISAFDFINLGFNNFGRAWGVSFRTLAKLIGPLILMIVSYVLVAVSVTMSLSSGLMSGSSVSSSTGAFLSIISSLLIIVAVIWMTVKSYYYSLAQFVAFDEPNLTPKQCVEKSEHLMNGHRGKLFILQLSFIGWILLLYLAIFILGLISSIISVIALAIGVLLLVPYIQMATIAFYDTFAHNREMHIDGTAEIPMDNK